jgi:hypothetical protein
MSVEFRSGGTSLLNEEQIPGLILADAPAQFYTGVAVFLAGL